MNSVRLSLALSMLLSSGLSFSMEIEPIAQNTQSHQTTPTTNASRIQPTDSCPVCQEEARSFPTDQIMQTECCKKFICKKDAQELERKTQENIKALQDPAQRAAFLEQNAGWRESVLSKTHCPFCRATLTVKEATVQKELVKEHISVIDSNGEEKIFSLEESTSLLECETLKDLIEDTYHNKIDFRAANSFAFPITVNLLDALIACIENPIAAAVNQEHLKEGELLLIAYQWNAPLMVQWKLAQQCYKQLEKKLKENNNKLLHTTYLGTALKSLLSLGNFLLLELPYPLSDSPTSFGVGLKEFTIPSSIIVLNTNLGHALTKEKLEFLKAVATVSIVGNKLIDFSIKELKKAFPLLDRLNLSGNNISHLHKYQFEDMTRMFRLDLSNNPIVNIDSDCFDPNKKIATRVPALRINVADINLRRTHLTAEQLANAHLSTSSAVSMQLAGIPLVGTISSIMGGGLMGYLASKLIKKSSAKNVIPVPAIPAIIGLFGVLAITKSMVAYSQMNEGMSTITIDHESGKWRLFKNSGLSRWWEKFKK